MEEVLIACNGCDQDDGNMHTPDRMRIWKNRLWCEYAYGMLMSPKDRPKWHDLPTLFATKDAEIARLQHRVAELEEEIYNAVNLLDGAVCPSPHHRVGVEENDCEWCFHRHTVVSQLKGVEAKSAGVELEEKLKTAKSLQLKPSNNPKDWLEDLPLENGFYDCKCRRCEDRFFGHKRRLLCRKCYVESLETRAVRWVSKDELCVEEVGTAIVRLPRHPDGFLAPVEMTANGLIVHDTRDSIPEDWDIVGIVSDKDLIRSAGVE